MSRPQISSRHHKQPRLRFTDSAALTSFAGLVVVQALFGVLDFSERLRRKPVKGPIQLELFEPVSRVFE